MKGILINYEYCTGCHSCEVACRNELGLGKGEFGIKITEVGPFKYETDILVDTPYEWVYNPTITKACDLCAARTEQGKMPSCVQACQAWCMYYGEAEDLVKKMDGKTRWALYTPVQGETRSESWVKGGGGAPLASTAAVGGAAAGAKSETSVEAEYHGTRGAMEVNAVFRGADKLTSFIAQFAAIDEEAAKEQIIDQILADEKVGKYTLAATDASDGADHELSFMGICMSYDAQGTQLGGGKAYLDKGQEIARKDITIVF